MVSLDERTGNVVTTVALFVGAAAILYVARMAFLALFLALLFAFLVEPSVGWMQAHSVLGRGRRTLAIIQVFAIGTATIVGAGFWFGPGFLRELKSLRTEIPGILERLPSRRAWIASALSHHQDFINRIVERIAAAAGYVIANSIWLLVVPILAIFVLRDGRDLLDAIVATIEPQENRALVRRIFARIDRMLARYVRAQLALSGLSFAFYSTTMMILGFPYAVALGALGGALEFVPAVGWVGAAGLILAVGFLANSHWIWMAALLVAWRLVQDYVNSPRIMGDSLELQPLTVVFALMVGGQVGGVAGVYLAVPVVAVLRVAWVEVLSARSGSSGERHASTASLNV